MGRSRIAAAAATVLAVWAGAGASKPVVADVVSIGASKDNTLFGDPFSAGSISNGAGPHMYVGKAGGGTNTRRGLLAFDLASAGIPAGATINAATLSLNVSQMSAAATDVALFRVTQDWGEGTSNSGEPGGQGAPATPGDATWLHTFYPDQFWNTPGGDFASTSSGSFNVVGIGAYQVSVPGLVSDIVGWLAAPSTNFGWGILAADEANQFGAMRFDTRENTVESVRPLLSIDFSAPAVSWNVDAGGLWSTAGNWSGGAVPDGAGANVTFDGAIHSDRTITLDSPRTVGALTFDNPTAHYTLAGSATLTLSSAAGASVSVLSGSHTIDAPVALATNTNVTVTPAGGALTISAPVQATAAGVMLAKSGAGRLQLRSVHSDGLRINAGTISMIADSSPAGTTRVKSLSVAGATDAWTATLDLNRNALVIDYDDTGSPIATVANQVKTAYAGGSWTGPGGITSSAAAASAGSAHKMAVGFGEASGLFSAFPATFAGESVDATAVLVRFTASGDANLDGKVDTLDFNSLAANFGGTGKIWSQADFNYDGVVDTLDFNNLAANFGVTASSSIGASPSLVPEPTVTPLVLACFASCLARRRSRRSNRDLLSL